MLNRKKMDELYHLLREASNSELASERESVLALTCHLLKGPSYPDLWKFEEYYGEAFLVKPVIKALKAQAWQFNRVVDIGCGTGWLGNAISKAFGIEMLGVDKRQTPVCRPLLIVDLETPDGIEELLAELKFPDLLAMSDFLHCVSNHDQLLNNILRPWPMVILEYSPDVLSHYWKSFSEQLKRYEAESFSYSELVSAAYSRKVVHQSDIGPYVLILAEGKNGI